MIIAAFSAGALNAVAGGGSFLSFPALVFVGLPAVAANATNTVALFPGSFASAFSYRGGIAKLEGVSLKMCLIVSMVGGGLGSILLLITPDKTFLAITPWLLLFATGMFAFGKAIREAIQKHFKFGWGALLVTQAVISIYGGYFGGGIGLLMLAAFSIYGMTDLSAMNGLKAILAGCLNGVAVIIFVIAGKVYWSAALTMMAAAIAGGYYGAVVAQRISQRALRIFVTSVGIVMSACFFFHAYARK